ncbi:MAG: plasmid replication initiator [Gammaproteobacteria bacterium]|nr:plasmid replication initiator [Gammaproteobacteria bacterium]
MVSETPKPESPLLPDRYPQHDLFICDVADAVLKDIMPQMEHPFYSLSKKPDTSIRRYEHNGHWLEITPSVKGLATIYDKDILIYCISQLMERLKRGEPIGPRVRINSHELLIFVNRGTAGKDYKALQEAIDRLAGTRISTNIRTGNTEQYDNFGLIDAASIRRTHGLDGRLLWCEVKLSEWVFNAIQAQEVLTLHRDYFRLKKPSERRIYEIARKHCGQQESWSCSVTLLLKKAGSRSSLKEFRRAIRHLAKHDHLPDYAVRYDEERDQVVFTNRGSVCPALSAASPETEVRPLRPDTYERAKACAPGWDVYYIEAEWRDWLTEPPRDADAAFLGFCKKWYEKRGPAR